MPSPFAANVGQIMLTQCIKVPEPTTIAKPRNRKVVARVKLPPIVTSKYVP